MQLPDRGLARLPERGAFFGGLILYTFREHMVDLICKALWRDTVMDIEWVEGYRIFIRMRDNEVLLSANREGLLSLAEQLKTLAEGKPGDHFHYDEHNALETGSAQLVIEKVK